MGSVTLQTRLGATAPVGGMGWVPGDRRSFARIGVERHRRSARGDVLGRLTPRETDVLAAIAEGRTNAAIAETLLLSRRAVEKHINSIFSKLCLTGDEARHPRVQAVLIYLAESQPTRERSEDPSALSDVSTRGPVPRCPVDRTHLHRHLGRGHRLAGRRPA